MTNLGTTYAKDRAVDFDLAGKRVTAVRFESGRRLAVDSVVNAANCWGPELCDKVGMKVPVHPIRRLTFYFEIRAQLEADAADRAHQPQCQLSAARGRLH